MPETHNPRGAGTRMLRRYPASSTAGCTAAPTIMGTPTDAFEDAPPMGGEPYAVLFSHGNGGAGSAHAPTARCLDSGSHRAAARPEWATCARANAGPSQGWRSSRRS